MPMLAACRHMPIALAGALLLGSPAGAAEHTLMPSPQTVHIGYFLASVKPVLTIDSGDIVTLESVAADRARSVDRPVGRGAAERRAAIPSRHLRRGEGPRARARTC